MAGPATTKLLQKLRALMKSTRYVTEAVQAYIIPSCDEHQNEYLPEYAKRREFISHFTGSAGTAVVTENKAALWTDGRYFLQAEKELDANWTLMKDGLVSTLKIEDWLGKELPIGSKVGVDPFLITIDRWHSLSKALEGFGLHLVYVEENLVDLIWEEEGRPSFPSNEICTLDLKYAGKTWRKKVADVQAKLRTKNAYALVVTALDEVAWLFNLRGSDIKFNPVFLAYAMVTVDSVSLFVDEKKLNFDVIRHLGGHSESDGEEDTKPSSEVTSLSVELHPYTAIQDAVKDIVAQGKGKLWISLQSSTALGRLVQDKSLLISEMSPICLAKAIKNEVEIQGMKNSHIRDAAALCEYFAWLEKEVPKGYLDEVSAAEKLAKLRSAEEDFVGLSFETISAVGPNGAIIHYRPCEDSSRILTCDELYLVDSGGQYKDGTTDVTRTVHFGSPTRHEQECFTRVLKGHIAVARTIFPHGVKGHVLDILGRKPLWDVGLDFMHGIGHGVGSYLNVHEGPQRISKRYDPNEVCFQAGMFISDEPGYYDDGHFGIRIESILLTVDVKPEHNFKNVGWLGFEPVTLVPIQTKMLVPDMLTEGEIEWLNNYHAQCSARVGKLLEEQGNTEALQWLLRETRPLG